MNCGSLDRAVRQIGINKLPIECLKYLLWSIAKGLEALHLREGGPIVHRDIKDANIVTNLDADVYIIDFGIAAPIDR